MSNRFPGNFVQRGKITRNYLGRHPCTSMCSLLVDASMNYCGYSIKKRELVWRFASHPKNCDSRRWGGCCRPTPVRRKYTSVLSSSGGSECRGTRTWHQHVKQLIQPWRSNRVSRTLLLKKLKVGESVCSTCHLTSWLLVWLISFVEKVDLSELPCVSKQDTRQTSGELTRDSSTAVQPLLFSPQNKMPWVI